MKCDKCGCDIPCSLEYFEDDKYITKYFCENGHEKIVEDESMITPEKEKYIIERMSKDWGIK